MSESPPLKRCYTTVAYSKSASALPVDPDTLRRINLKLANQIREHLENIMLTEYNPLPEGVIIEGKKA